MTGDEVTIVIPNLDGDRMLPNCGESIRRQSHPVTVTVIDNGSSDGSVEVLKRMFPDFEVIRNPTNLGYAVAVNQGVSRALERQADWILLLNNDATLSPTYVSDLLAASKRHAATWALSGKIQNARTGITEYFGGEIDWWRGRSLAWTEGHGRSAPNAPRYVTWAPAVALMVKADAFRRVGLLDPVYFAYWEETDFLMRLSKDGKRILFVPDAVAHHVGRATADRFPGLFPYYAFARNRLIFMKRWAPRKTLPIFVCTYLFITVPGLSILLVLTTKGITSTAMFYRGLTAGVKALISDSERGDSITRGRGGRGT